MFWEEKRDNERINESKDGLKEAFAKVKTDIFTIGNEVYSMRNEVLELKNTISALNDAINSIKIDLLDIKNSPRYPTNTPTQVYEKPTYPMIPSDTPTVPVETRGLKYPNLPISTRNRGVPTDRQTNQQTDIHRGFSDAESDFDTPLELVKKPLKTQIHDAEEILNSLDNLKKEIRLKFKTITSQEMLVFSTIYQLESDFPEGIEYRQIASRLRLSESSIRDYTQKLISKGIPVDKIKLNNKKILLKIAPKLKNIAPLDTLIKLREL